MQQNTPTTRQGSFWNIYLINFKYPDLRLALSFMQSCLGQMHAGSFQQNLPFLATVVDDPPDILPKVAIPSLSLI